MLLDEETFKKTLEKAISETVGKAVDDAVAKERARCVKICRAVQTKKASDVLSNPPPDVMRDMENIGFVAVMQMTSKQTAKAIEQCIEEGVSGNIKE